MTFTSDTFSRSSFKLLQGLAHTTNDKDPANESEATTISLSGQDIFGDTIPINPLSATATGVAVFQVLDLVLDPASNGKAYFAEITTVAGSNLDGYTNPRTGIAYADGDRVGYLIPTKFGPDYRAILRDGGTEVPPLSAEDWYFDYRAGIVISEDNLSLGVGTIEGYVYVGEFISNKIAGLQAWEFAGTDIQNLNAGSVLPAADLTHNFGSPTRQWKDGYFESLTLSGNITAVDGYFEDLIASRDITAADGSLLLGEGRNQGAGTVRWTGNNFQGNDGYQWVNLDSNISTVSVTLLNAGTANDAQFNPFARANFSSFIEGVDWQHNSSGGNIEFRPDDGYFVVNKTAAYAIGVSLFIIASSTTQAIHTIFKNDDIIYTVTEEINSAVDPTERSWSIIEDLEVGDVIRLEVDPQDVSDTYAFQPGTTFTIEAVGLVHSSTATLSASIASSVEFNIWDENNFSSFVKGTDWDDIVVPQNIIFTQDNGRFTFPRKGTYKIKLHLVLDQSLSVLGTHRLKKNGVTFYDIDVTINTAVEPPERTICVIVDLDADDFLEITSQASSGSLSTQPGTTLNISKLNSSRISTSLLTDSTGTGSEFNPFDEDSHAAFVENSNWTFNNTPSEITFDQVAGRFRVERSGPYRVEVCMILNTTVTDVADYRIKRNGITIFTSTAITHTAVDPNERSISFITEMVAGDTLELTIDAASGLLTANRGTTLSLYRILAEDAQSGPWSVAGSGTDVYFDRGNVSIGAPPTSDFKLEIGSQATSYTNNSILLNSRSATDGEAGIAFGQLGPAGLGVDNYWWMGINMSDYPSMHLLENFTPTNENQAWSLRTEVPTVFDSFTSTIPNIYQHMRSDGYTGIYLEADVDNSPSTEGHVPFIFFAQDTNLTNFYIGGTGFNPVGGVTIGAGGSGGGPAIAPAGTLNNGMLIGSLANTNPVQIATNNIIRMTVIGSGDVGIGTNSPNAKLEVSDTGTAQLFAVNTEPSGSGGGGFLYGMHDDGSAMGSGDRLGGFLVRGADGAGTYYAAAGMVGRTTEAWTGSAGGTRLDFETTDNTTQVRDIRMTIQENGFVGINTTDPEQRMHVVESAETNVHYNSFGPLIVEDDDNIIQVVFDDSGVHGGGISFSAAPGAGNNRHWVIHHTATGTPTGGLQLRYGTSASSGVNLGSIGNEIMVWETGGNVGIGTTGPDQLLHVAGSIRLGVSDSDQHIIGDGALAVGSDGDVIIVADVNDIAGTSAGNIIFGAGSASAATNVDYATMFPAGVPRNEYMRIEAVTGDVGIGEASPIARLHVQDASIGTDPVTIFQTTGVSDDVAIQLIGTANTFTFGVDDSAGGDFVIADSAFLGTTNRFTIDTGGTITLNAGTTGGIDLLAGTGDIDLDSDDAIFLRTGVDNDILIFESTSNEYARFDGSAEGLAIGISVCQTQRLDVRGPTQGTSNPGDYVAQFANTGTTETGWVCLKLSTGEATTENTDDFLTCFSNETGSGGGTVEYRIRGDGTTATSFTLQHWAVYEITDGYDGYGGYSGASFEWEIQPGMIVESTGKAGLNGTLQDAIPILKRCKTDACKKVYGVLSSDWDGGRDMGIWRLFDGYINSDCMRDDLYDGYGEYMYDKDQSMYDDNSPYIKARTNSGGDGKIWITEKDGYVQNGDYITSSVIPGYGSLQSDDILHSYTVAKCVQDIDWASITDVINYEGTDYKRILVGCTYHCG